MTIPSFINGGLDRRLVGFFIFISLTGAKADAPLRIVSCDEQVQSHKRGICANKLDEADFRALAPGVSWYYNWHYEDNDPKPSDVPMEFIPMAWGDRQEDLDGLENTLRDASPKPRAVLAINEPNLKGQSFIPPQETATLYGKIKTIADRYSLPVVGPNMSLGSPADGSIQAMDPIDNKVETYTFMVPFLKAFFYYVGSTPPPAALGLHTYGSIGEMKWAVQTMHDTFKCPIWVTEYAEWNAADNDAEREYLIQATDFLERTPYVEGYAWFKERADNGKIGLFTPQSGELSPLGQTYVSLPVHEKDVYYRIPGKLSAGKYTAFDQGDIFANAHNNIFVTSTAAGATVDYQIQVDTAGTYKLEIKALAGGKIDVLENNQVLASVTGDGNEVQALDATVSLPAGPQTLRCRLNASGMTLSSLEFTKS